MFGVYAVLGRIEAVRAGNSAASSRSTSESRRRGRVNKLPMMALAMLALLLFGATAQAQVVRNFAVRAEFNDFGDGALIGNTLLTCTSSNVDHNGNNTLPSCSSVQAGTNTSDGSNNRQMQYVNTEGVAGGTTYTRNSSTADLNMPAGSTVLFAGLYWGARFTATCSGLGCNLGGGTWEPDTRGTLEFRAPGGSWQTITASQLDTITHPSATANSHPYMAFADVTSLVVNAGGNGTYAARRLTARLGNDGLGYYGGWSLIVLYENPGEPFRRLMVYDGAANVTGSVTQTVNVTGLLTPATGTFNTYLGAVTWEGDQGIVGDRFQLNGQNLSSSVNPANNFWNSTIARLGAHITAKNPNYVNQLGMDINYADASGILANSATTAQVQFVTDGDAYFPHALVFVSDLHVPDLVNSLNKTATDVNGGNTVRGDEIEYTISFTNTGADGATNVVLTDPIPPGTTFVPGSFEILSNAIGAPTGPLTDQSGDDVAEYDAANNRVVFRFGSGATATQGGLIPPGQGGSFRFRVRVNDDLTAGSHTITNTVSVIHNAQTLTDDVYEADGSAETEVIVVEVAQAGLQITKTNTPGQNNDIDLADDTVIAGGSTVYRIVVTNAGPDAANDAVLTDTAVSGLDCLTPAQLTCGSETGNAACPAAPLEIGALLDPAQGIAIPVLPANGSVTFQLTCTVAPGP